MKESNVYITQGKFFPRPIVYLAYVGILFGVIGFTENWLTGLFIIAISAFVGFNVAVLEVDSKNKRLRNYLFLFGIKSGKWTSFQEYPDLAVLRKNVSEQTSGARVNRSVITHEVFYDICILDATHRKKISIQRFDDQVNAEKELLVLAKKLNLNSTEYKPKIIPRTKNRR